MINATQSYRNAQVNTVGRAEVTLMLYDGLLRFLDLAAENMKQKNIQAKGNYISRALDIINELDCTLNMEQGGEVSKGLHNLYLLMNKNLLMANLKNDLELLQSVRNNMQVIRDTFSEAMQTPEAKQVLAKMGPVTQGTATSGFSATMAGGSIQERSKQIKIAQERAESIEIVKKKLEQAKTDEEKMLVKKELEDLLGNGIVKTATKPVSMAMAQKASRAFVQQQNAINNLGQMSHSVPSQTGEQFATQLQKQNALLKENEEKAKTENTALENQTPTMRQSQETINMSDSVIEQKPLQQPTLKSSGLLSKKISLYKNA